MGGGGKKPQKTVTTSGTPDWSRPYIESAAKDAQRLYKSGQLDQVAGLNADQRAAAQATRQMQQHTQGLQRAAGSLYADAGKGAAYDRAQGVSAAAAEGTGMFGAGHYGTVTDQLQPQINDQITQALGAQQGAFAQSGALGGARAQAASASSAGQIAGQMAASEVASQRQGAFSGSELGVNTANTQYAQRMGAMNQRFGAAELGMASTAGLAASGQAQQDQRQAELDAKYQGIQRMFGLINPNTVGTKQESTTTGGGGK